MYTCVLLKVFKASELIKVNRLARSQAAAPDEPEAAKVVAAEGTTATL